MISSLAYKAGLREFDCGSCPECLKKRANKIMVRDVYEASSHVDNCMITLTYDNYVRDKSGKIIGERVSDKSVDKRDVQLFIKRLRSFVWRKYHTKIKYRLSAEYGKTTHRAHYHVLIFGFTFPDCVFYKKSKRGSVIYKSAILNKLWRNGICTVDAKTISASIARYCSKYTNKDKGCEDTFSLCSQGIGIDAMMKDFNGLYYIVEGVKYPIPKIIWEKYITNKYKDCEMFLYGKDFIADSSQIDPRYVNRDKFLAYDPYYYLSSARRATYRAFRDHDDLYIRYLEYWNNKVLSIKSIQPSVFDRIRSLPDDKYGRYKSQALDTLRRRYSGIPADDPRKKTHIYQDKWYAVKYLPLSSCLTTASDTKSFDFEYLTPLERVSSHRCELIINKNHTDFTILREIP